MGRGYSGNHPRFSHRQDERYDAKEAYNKDLTASARLHYLENDRHDHESPAHSHCSPMHMHNDRHIKRQAERIARKNEGDVQDIYYELKSRAAQDERSGKKRGNDERSGEERRKDIDEMIYERPDSPMNNNHFRPGDYSPEMRQRLIDKGFILKPGDVEFPARPDFPSGGVVKPNFDKPGDDPKPPMPEPPFSGRGGGVIRRQPDEVIDDRYGDRYGDRFSSPMNACAKSEGGSGCVKQMGGAWRVISNKTDKPWPAKYASKSKAEAALRGYHAG